MLRDFEPKDSNISLKLQKYLYAFIFLIKKRVLVSLTQNKTAVKSICEKNLTLNLYRCSKKLF